MTVAARETSKSSPDERFRHEGRSYGYIADTRNPPLTLVAEEDCRGVKSAMKTGDYDSDIASGDMYRDGDGAENS